MRTRPASLATVAIAIGLALTTVGLARQLPYTFGGAGTRSTVGADLWAHGSAVSPPLVALVVLGILAAISMRPTRGGRRASLWIAVLGGTLVVTGLAEAAQRDVILISTVDAALTPLLYGLHIALVALVLAAVGEARRPVADQGSGISIESSQPIAVASAQSTPTAIRMIPTRMSRSLRVEAPGSRA